MNLSLSSLVSIMVSSCGTLLQSVVYLMYIEDMTTLTTRLRKDGLVARPLPLPHLLLLLVVMKLVVLAGTALPLCLMVLSPEENTSLYSVAERKHLTTVLCNRKMLLHCSASRPRLGKCRRSLGQGLR